MQPYFRDAVRDDVPAIATILHDTGPHGDFEQAGSVETCCRALAEIDRRDGNYVLVAEYDGRIGAVLQLLTFSRLHGGGGRTAQIVALHVADAFRTTGIGGLLLEHAIGRAHDLGCDRLCVSVSTARRDEHPFWERAGFVHVDRGYARPLP